MLTFKKNSGTNRIQTAIDIDEINKLIECLKQCDLSKPVELELCPSSPLFDVVKVINQIIEARKNALTDTMLDINEAVRQMTGMTSIREMLRRIQEQTPQIANMSAQAEEMGAAAGETASTASNAASFVEQSLNMATSGVEEIEQAVGFVERSFTQFELVSKQVQEVLDSMNEIEQIVSVIAGVADQTNLLALNAAIEAARAGEQGRGFAVVADEVRKLAEHTKDSVTNIQQKIEVLSQNSYSTANDMLSLSNMMTEGKSVMQGAGQEVRQILQNIEMISENIQQIAAGNEEQSVVVEEFAQMTSLISESAHTTEHVALQTGEGIYAISRQLQELRTRQISKVPIIDSPQALELSKTDHLLWTWRIYNMLLGYEKVDPETIDTHRDCRLGIWANGPEAQALRQNPTFLKLPAPHQRVHDLARQAALAYSQGDINQAGELLAQMSQASQEVVEILEELEHLM